MEQGQQAFKFAFLIVGAGPGGLTLGIELRRQGFDVLILDAQPGPKRPICGEYLSPQGVDALKRMKLDSVLEGFEPILGMTLVSPKNRSVLAEFPERRYGLALDRQRFQSRLVDFYLAQGGKLNFGEKVLQIEERDGAYRIRTDRSDNSFYETKYLIGADGRRSTVSRLLGMKEEKPKRSRVAIHCYLRPKVSIARFGQMHILPDGSYVGINPIHSEEVNFSVVTDAECAKNSENLKAIVNRWIRESPSLNAQFEEVRDEEVKATFPITRISRSVARRNVALIGDASGFIDPLTGEGITTAIKTAAILAQKITSHRSIEEAIAAYARARKSDFRQKEILNRGLQILIRHPVLCEGVALLLGGSRRLRNIFIGVIGNIYSPCQAIKIIVSSFFGKES